MEPQRSEQPYRQQKELKREKILRPIVPPPDMRPQPRETEETSAAQWVCMVMGVAFILIGLAGFVIPNLFGMHLGWGHNIIHLVSGAASLWFGITRSFLTAERFSYGFGGFYAALGIIGFIAGTNTNMIPPMMDHDSFWWPIIPGSLEFGTADHIIHLLIGGAFILGAYMTARRMRKVVPKGTMYH